MGSSERCGLVGGPHCGVTVSQRSEPFLWVQSSAKGAKVFLEPGPKRVMYRRLDAACYLFAELLWIRCVGCGGVQPRSKDRCRLCGNSLLTT